MCQRCLSRGLTQWRVQSIALLAQQQPSPASATAAAWHHLTGQGCQLPGTAPQAVKGDVPGICVRQALAEVQLPAAASAPGCLPPLKLQPAVRSKDM